MRALVTFAGKSPGKKIDICAFMREWRKLVSGKVKAGKNRNQWTEEEDWLLLKLRETGIGWEEIGEQLGRTVTACRERHNRLRRLGMKTKNKLEGAV
ncbi:Myb-like DNA-binding domain-containing protein [Moorella naiadis]